MEQARKIMVMLFCGIGILSTGAAAYVALKVYAPGWYKHDNSITVTMPNGTQYKYQLENSK